MSVSGTHNIDNMVVANLSLPHFLVFDILEVDT